MPERRAGSSHRHDTVMASPGWGIFKLLLLLLLRAEPVLSFAALFLGGQEPQPVQRSRTRSGTSPTPAVIAASVRIAATLEIMLGLAESLPAG